MKIQTGIFGPGSNFNERFIPDLTRLVETIEACRILGYRIVLTSGTFDLIHEGHANYLEAARSHGDLLVVGVDSDDKVKKRKGPDRPIVPEAERVKMLIHLRHVDIVTLKGLSEDKWILIKAIRPDVLIATQATYSAADIEALKEFCGEIVILEPMSTTSTTARIRLLLINFSARVAEGVKEMLDKMVRGEKDNDG